MYSSATGAFRDALDRWRSRIQAATRAKDRTEARRLALVVEDIAHRWLLGEPQDRLADALAAEIDS